jgi:aromatase
MQINWDYTEVPEGTLMRWAQDFAMRTGGPVDTAGMTRIINTRTPEQMALIKARIEARWQARQAEQAQQARA